MFHALQNPFCVRNLLFFYCFNHTMNHIQFFHQSTESLFCEYTFYLRVFCILSLITIRRCFTEKSFLTSSKIETSKRENATVIACSCHIHAIGAFVRSLLHHRLLKVTSQKSKWLSFKFNLLFYPVIFEDPVVLFSLFDSVITFQ